jgi:hypothetical protein
MIPVDFILLVALWAFIIYAIFEINERIEGKGKRACMIRLCFIVPMYGLFAIATILTTLHHI